jgi:hypothetical protein
MKVYTREDAAQLIEKSEGQVIDPSKPGALGHSHAHVGSLKSPALDLPSRRKLTTMYRNRAQAEKDLRDLLNRHSPQLEVLPKSASIEFSDPVNEPRQVYVVEPVGAHYSYAGESVKTEQRQELFVKIMRGADGTLHLRTMYLKGN